MILTEAVKKEIISEKTANSLYVGMRDMGINLPCNSFYEYYDKLYDIDCENFLKR